MVYMRMCMRFVGYCLRRSGFVERLHRRGVCLIAVKRDCGALVSGLARVLVLCVEICAGGEVLVVLQDGGVTGVVWPESWGLQTRQCERAYPIARAGWTLPQRSARRIASAGPGSGSTHHRCLELYGAKVTMVTNP